MVWIQVAQSMALMRSVLDKAVFKLHLNQVVSCPTERPLSSEDCSVKLRAYQYNETNVMQFSFNLLIIKGFYMVRALRAHPQEALQLAVARLQ
jgi:hypothetical protein